MSETRAPEVAGRPPDGAQAPRRLPLPTWVLLGGLIALSVAVRFVWALRDPAAWIFPDETIYAELAKSLADTGAFSIRDNPGTLGVGVVYPLLIAPAYMLFESAATAHDAVKAINSLLMSLGAIPIYLLARRLVGRGLAITAAALSLAIPALMYTGTVMTENAFYPVTLMWVLLLVRALERPTIGRQTLVVAAIGVAYVTRAQAATFVPALLTAILLLAVIDDPRHFWRGLWRFRATAVLFALGALAVVGRQVLRGERLSDVMGAYIALRDYDYGVAAVSHWWLLHAAEFVIVLGVFPMAAFLAFAALSLRRGAPRSDQVFMVAAVSVVFWFSIVVSAFANTPVAQRIVERYLFHVTPLFFIAFVAWIARGLPRPWWAIAPAVLLTAALPAALPLNNFLNETAVHDTISLIPVWRWRERFFSPETIDEVVIGAAILGALVVLLVPRRFALAMVAALFVYYAAASRPVEAYIYRASFGAWEAGVRPIGTWVDREVGAGADVAQVWTGGGNHFSFWESEFYNRSVGPVYALSTPYDGFGQRPATILPSGRVTYLGETLELGYALTDAWTRLRGKRVATNELTSMAIYRIDGPLRVIDHFQGLYPDGWSSASVAYRRYGCEGGAIRFDFQTNPRLHTRPFVVTVIQHGVETGRRRIPPVPDRKSLTIPLVPKDGYCFLFLTIPTRPATLETPADLRQLGLRFESLRYVPRR